MLLNSFLLYYYELIKNLTFYIFKEVHLYFLFYFYFTYLLHLLNLSLLFISFIVSILILKAEGHPDQTAAVTTIVIASILGICAIVVIAFDAIKSVRYPRGIDQNTFNQCMFCFELISDFLKDLHAGKLTAEEAISRKIKINTFISYVPESDLYLLFNLLTTHLDYPHDYFSSVNDIRIFIDAQFRRYFHT